MNIKKQITRGFTIVELLVVMVIIGILASITIVVYSGIQAKARDVSVLSDLDRMAGVQANYGLKHKTAGKAYYSLNGHDSDLAFDPSNGNVVSVTVNATDYCIRGYNVNGTNNSIDNSLVRESTVGACALIAAVNPPPTPAMAVALNGVNALATITPATCSTGTIQYQIRSRTNDGSWGDYTAWSAATTATQAASEGVKYGYQAQARCYVDEALISSSMLGSEVTYTAVTTPPPAPDIVVTQNGGNIVATITTVTCPAGTTQYGIRSRINDGSWTDYSAWSSSTTTASQAASQGVKYGYQAQARCYVNGVLISSSSVGAEGTYTVSTDPPPAIAIAVTLNGGSILATITPASCSGAGIIQYQIRSRTNDGGWGGYSAWSSTTTASQGASEGVKYGYQAQARCYVNDTSYSSSSTSSEGTYIMYINAPGAPSVWVNSVPDWQTTWYAWGGSSCPAGTSLTYYYYYWNPAGNSGWIGTTNTSVPYSTAHIGWWFNIQVAAQCSNGYASSGWSGANSTSYSRPVPSVRVLVVGGGGAGGSSTADASGGGGGGGGVSYHSGVNVYSQGYWVTVGGGGGCNSCDGGTSDFNGVGGYGGGGGGPTNEGGHNGGSGGGGAGAKDGSTNTWGNPTYGYGGTQNWGNHGGLGQWRANGKSGGGGGGAGQCGGDAYNGTCGGKMVGGSGIYNDITGGGVYYAGGGGGGSCCYWGAGGNGGGGNGAQNGHGSAGGGNTGGGGGGGGSAGGGNGGSGIVVIRYNGNSLGAGGGGAAYWNGSDIVQIFYGSSTFTVYG